MIDDRQVGMILKYILINWNNKSYDLKTFFAIIKEEFEDTKGVIRICISKNRQHKGQKKKYKRTNNDLQNIHIKLKIEYHEPH
jgi:hypothetical protein